MVILSVGRNLVGVTDDCQVISRSRGPRKSQKTHFEHCKSWCAILGLNQSQSEPSTLLLSSIKKPLNC